ncbi:MAG TPA: twin-arginine translocase TatA/TatE family subunit [Anaerolineae bacterium]|nr:twin-arginine translocase TatA/TatE family subunit [Anaerolineae bacterium]
MLFKNLGVPELILILVVAMLIFGPGRIGKLGSELGRGIRGFQEGLKSKEDKEKEKEKEEKALEVVEASTESEAETEA